VVHGVGDLQSRGSGHRGNLHPDPSRVKPTKVKIDLESDPATLTPSLRKLREAMPGVEVTGEVWR